MGGGRAAAAWSLVTVAQERNAARRRAVRVHPGTWLVDPSGCGQSGVLHLVAFTLTLCAARALSRVSLHQSVVTSLIPTATFQPQSSVVPFSFSGSYCWPS